MSIVRIRHLAIGAAICLVVAACGSVEAYMSSERWMFYTTRPSNSLEARVQGYSGNSKKSNDNTRIRSGPSKPN